MFSLGKKVFCFVFLKNILIFFLLSHIRVIAKGVSCKKGERRELVQRPARLQAGPPGSDLGPLKSLPSHLLGPMLTLLATGPSSHNHGAGLDPVRTRCHLPCLTMSFNLFFFFFNYLQIGGERMGRESCQIC